MLISAANIAWVVTLFRLKLAFPCPEFPSYLKQLSPRSVVYYLNSLT